MIKWSNPMTGLEEGCSSYTSWRYRIQIYDGKNKMIARYDNVTDLNFSQVKIHINEKYTLTKIHIYEKYTLTKNTH